MKKNIKLKLGMAGIVMTTPMVALAGSANVITFLHTIKQALDIVVPIMVVLALIYFVFGLGEYILESGETSKIQEGRTRMIWGTIAMFVLVSVWGIIQLLQNTIGDVDKTKIEAPSVPSAKP